MKSTRQNAILEIIRDRDIDTQEELADELRRRNFSVTQATVSRDIRELRLIKVLTSSGQYKYATADKPENGLSERFHRIFSESVLGMSHCYNQIIIRTLNGSANAAAEMLDSLHWPEIMGTLAGDNTILMIVRSVEEVDVVLHRIDEMLR
ncbi:MAG TPA: arginine repressor [Candidatus Limiplasma sp.]|jgi:transcriptional regulator of arginine metabolism|nr:arginine repressor [Candidatus Limiplasma sp.]HPR77663.1 arginine repressor [Candidatus Limiplasma sp.]